MDYDVEIWPIGQVKRYSNNPRKNEEAVEAVARSLKDFGWKQPIVVDEDGVIVVGDTRYLAAHSLKMAEVPVHVAKDLTEHQVRAYRIADNRTGEISDWDLDRLAEELQGLVINEVEFDIESTGFSELEVSGLLEGIDEDLEDDEGYEPEVHKKRKTKCPSCGHEF